MTLQMYRVCRHAYQDHGQWFLDAFTKSLILVYKTCPSPLSAITLEQFLKTSDPDDYCEWFEMIRQWKRLLERQHPRVYERFDIIYEAFVTEDSEPPQTREARKTREAR